MNCQRTVLQVEKTAYAKALRQGKAFRVLRHVKAPRVEGVGKRVGRWRLARLDWVLQTMRMTWDLF